MSVSTAESAHLHSTVKHYSLWNTAHCETLPTTQGSTLLTTHYPTTVCCTGCALGEWGRTERRGCWSFTLNNPAELSSSRAEQQQQSTRAAAELSRLPNFPATANNSPLDDSYLCSWAIASFGLKRCFCNPLAFSLIQKPKVKVQGLVEALPHYNWQWWYDLMCGNRAE